jgi:predicted secreted protein
MSAFSGRDLVLSIAATAIAGARTQSITLDNSPVDISSIASGGFRALGNFSGNRKMDLSIAGVWISKVVRDLAYGADTALLLDGLTIDFPDGGDIAGDFFLANYVEEGAHDGEMTFTATLQSSGAFTYTTAA